MKWSTILCLYILSFQLKFAVNESPTIRVAPLPRRPNPINVMAEFLGWGPIRSVMSGKPVQLNKTVKKMAVSLHTKKVCDKYYPQAEEFFDLYCMSARWDNEHFFKVSFFINFNKHVSILNSLFFNLFFKFTVERRRWCCDP